MKSENELVGSVERVTFRNEANGFTVCELNTGDELITVVGKMFDIHPGEELNVRGRFDFHATFGPQFKADSVEKRIPTTAAAILRYLASGGIKGIGPTSARRIVEAFGSQSLEIIETDPERLTKIKGISKNKALEFQKEYIKQIGVRELMLYLGEYGITADESLKVYRSLGPAAIDRIKANPYLLCGDELPFSFERIDEMAEKMGFAPDFDFRKYSGIEYVLRHNLGNGHTCIPRDKVAATASGLLGVELDGVSAAIDRMLASGLLCTYECDGREMLFLPHMYRAERLAAERIKMLLGGSQLKVKNIDKRLAAVEKAKSINLEQRQRDAVFAAAESGITVLTGGPGTGKTTTLNAMIEVFESIGLRVMLTAPTGRAAKRMTEVTGREAKTIHRLLEAEFDQSGRSVFCKNRQSPLECELLIIDEISMVDAFMFQSVLDALPLGCRLILVGDADQLPSVGAGNVLRDLIDSGCVPYVELDTVFRQAMQSAIVMNAHRINAGELPDFGVKDSDFFFISCDTPSAASATAADLACSRLPKAYGFDPLTDIQILCPSRKREAGTGSLNALMQSRLNPADGAKHELKFPAFTLREGDKIMQIKNNYDIIWDKDDGTDGTGVFNGDVGRLERIDRALGVFTVRFDDKVAVYPVDMAEQIEPAYAVTVHKSQGSEYRCVVLVVSDTAPLLRYRNLLYTAVTRARELLVMVGDRRIVSEMIANDRRIKRYTALKFMVRELCK